MELTFDQAVELLEITDISKLNVSDIPQLEKKTKKRWHPDKVAHLNDAAITEEYKVKFQQIETACQMLTAYLQGTYHAGDAFTQTTQTVYEEPEEIIRKNAPDIQTTLKDLWTLIKEKKYKWHDKEVVLSDGFNLKDLLQEDFKEDIAMLSVVSFFYGMITFALLTAMVSLTFPYLGILVGIVWALHAVSCILGFAPLSRFWLPESIQEYVIKFINFGLKIYYWAESQAENSSSIWVTLLVRTPVFFARFLKYIMLFPLYELAKIFIGDKIVGVVKQRVNYYASAAEWYIDDLITKNPNEMTNEELHHLSYLYAELSDVKSKV